MTAVSADWNHWFRTNGIEPPPSIETGLRVDTIQMALDAAIRGLGVALGRRPMVDDDIDSGRLVTLADREIPSGNGYWLVTPQAEFQKPEVKQFKRWLLSELAVVSDESKSRPVMTL
jgi:DNA-binding transcriptional LysR family regulator